MRNRFGEELPMPAAFGRIQKHRERIEISIYETSAETLKEYWGVAEIEDNRLRQWCNLIAASASAGVGYVQALDVLAMIFKESNIF